MHYIAPDVQQTVNDVVASLKTTTGSQQLFSHCFVSIIVERLWHTNVQQCKVNRIISEATLKYSLMYLSLSHYSFVVTHQILISYVLLLCGDTTMDFTHCC